MRILWIKSDLLFPLDKGGKLRTWHLLRHLAVRHDITYLGFASPEDAPDAVDRMNEIATRVECVPRSDPPKRSFRFYLDVARYLFDPLPYAVAKYRSRAFVQRIDSLLRDQAFDLVVSDFVLPMVNIPARLPCPLVVFTHNVESEIWRRHAETRQHRLARALFNSQYRRALRFEEQALRRGDGVLAVSETDRDTLLRLYPAALREPPHVVQTGVDTSFFQPSPSSPSSRSLVFTGSMDWLVCPKVVPVIPAAGKPKVLWLKRLNASQRNCKE
jgi:hypothetical protein